MTTAHRRRFSLLERKNVSLLCLDTFYNNKIAKRVDDSSKRQHRPRRPHAVRSLSLSLLSVILFHFPFLITSAPFLSICICYVCVDARRERQTWRKTVGNDDELTFFFWCVWSRDRFASRRWLQQLYAPSRIISAWLGRLFSYFFLFFPSGNVREYVNKTLREKSTRWREN